MGKAEKWNWMDFDGLCVEGVKLKGYSAGSLCEISPIRYNMYWVGEIF